MIVQDIFIGVDGGATKCIVRVENEAGAVLGQQEGGAATIRFSPEKAWQIIFNLLESIIKSDFGKVRLHTVMGLAGCEMKAAHDAFCAHPFSARFHTLKVVSDAYIACLGAHAGKNGAIIIAGSGVVGFKLVGHQSVKVGGFGFPHDDEGSGAWMGLRAIRVTLKWLDGRAAGSGLAKAIYEHFNRDVNMILQFVNEATPTAFATLAPLVIQQYQQGDEAALTILKKAAGMIDEVTMALSTVEPYDPALRFSLLGGLSPFLKPFLNEKWRSQFHAPLASPEVGAILLARKLYSRETV